MSGSPPEAPGPEGRVLSLHLGRSANCSSIGSFVDLLFVSSVAGAAILAAVAATLGSQGEERRDPPEDPRDPP